MSRKITLDDLSAATRRTAAETRRYGEAIEKLKHDILKVIEEGDNAMQRGPSGDDGAEGGER